MNNEYVKNTDRVETLDGDFELRSECVELNAGDYGDQAGVWCLIPDSVELTLGQSAGKHAHTRDDIMYHDGDTWLECEEQHLYVIDFEGDWILRYDASVLTFGFHSGEYALAEECSYYEDTCWLSNEGAPDYLVLLQSEEYCHRDYAVFCDQCDEWFREDDECGHDENDENKGSSNTINEYHSTPSPVIYGFDSRNTYKIGFEVEKLNVDGESQEGDPVEESNFFAGWECDSSCGVEGISNVYCFDERGRELFLSHTDEVEDMLNEETSSSCGGHVNLSGPKVDLHTVRRYAGLFYAIYRHRLNNQYSSNDKGLRGSNNGYCAIAQKRNRVEFRLVSRVKTKRQLVWRFELFDLLTQAMNKGLSFRGFYDLSYKHLRKIYDRHKIKQIRSLAFDFQRYLDTGVITPQLDEFNLPTF